jgi:peptidyl-prolyl cis-trans isomerase C
MARFRGIGAAVSMGALMALSPVAGRAADVTAETVVATVNGTDITVGHVIAMRESLPEQYQQLPDDALYSGILEQLIQQTALAQAAEPDLSKRDLVNLENQRRAYMAGSLLQGVVTGAVTDEAIQAAYDARVRDLAASPMIEYNASHILVADEALATDLRAQLDAGADFAELAVANSTDGSAAGGGSLGWFGPGMMVKPFEDAVVALKPGEIAGPVQTQFGWHLVKLNETRVASAPTLDEMRDEIAGQIEQQTVEAFVQSKTDTATITRTDGIDPAVLRDQTLLGE